MKHFTPVFLHIFVKFMEKELSTKFYGVFNHFLQTCEFTKFLMVKRFQGM